MTFGEQVIRFYSKLEMNVSLPEGINAMNPFREKIIMDISSQFFMKFYCDENPRTFIFGINPGRFGAGVTGVTFTDPIRLEEVCGIPNPLDKKPELSSVFIYEMIERFGGAEKFYSRFYLSAVCPLGFVKNGKNLNYYDDRSLQTAVSGFIVDSIKQQLNFGANRDVAICLGEGKNLRFLKKLNEEHSFFKEIIPLAHPRFIMQYRMKRKGEFLRQYLDVFLRT